jgi:hypothetical protein
LHPQTLFKVNFNIILHLHFNIPYILMWGDVSCHLCQICCKAPITVHDKIK